MPFEQSQPSLVNYSANALRNDLTTCGRAEHFLLARERRNELYSVPAVYMKCERIRLTVLYSLELLRKSLAIRQVALSYGCSPICQIVRPSFRNSSGISLLQRA